MRTLGPVCCLLLALVAFPASGQDDYGDEYGDGDFARVRFAERGATVSEHPLVGRASSAKRDVVELDDDLAIPNDG